MNFTRKRTPTIMDGLVIRYEGDAGWANTPEISASRTGVAIEGAWPTLRSRIDIARVVAHLERAWSDHIELAHGRDPDEHPKLGEITIRVFDKDGNQIL